MLRAGCGHHVNELGVYAAALIIPSQVTKRDHQAIPTAGRTVNEETTHPLRLFSNSILLSITTTQKTLMGVQKHGTSGENSQPLTFKFFLFFFWKSPLFISSDFVL